MNANINTKRETEKVIEIDGRQFIIKKYDPLLGNYIVAQLLMYTMPSAFTQISQDVLAIDGAGFVGCQKRMVPFSTPAFTRSVAT